MRHLPVALVLSLAVAAQLAAAQSPCCDPWTDLGQALAGAAGAPDLQATGSLADGTQLVLDLLAAAPVAPAVLVVGQSALSAPFKGGVLVPAPDLLAPLVTDGAGQ